MIIGTLWVLRPGTVQKASLTNRLKFAFLCFVDEHCCLIAAAHGALQRHKE
jgi:hypothetical protein